MSTDLAVAPRLASEPMPRVTRSLFGRVVLLATDGSAASSAAARTAFAIAKRQGANIYVINVIDTRSAPLPPGLDLAIGIADAAVGPLVHAEQVESVRDDIAAAIGEPVDWRIRVALGTPARAIVQEAHRLRAALVIVGLRRHGRLERALQDETALEVMRRAACPVLGMAADATSLPIKALAAVDFSRSSLVAARATRAVLGDGGTIVLAYAPPVTFDLPDDGEAVLHKLGVVAGFARCRADLEGEDITIDQVTLHAQSATPVAAALLEYADGTGCDLIAAGSARRGRLDRWILGSVSTDLVRDGRHSVLIVPPRTLKNSVTPTP